MTAVIEKPNPQIALTLSELTACQHLARTHITFSLTLACPLSCAHCIVDAGPEKTATTMPLAMAERYAAQMPELAEYGIKGICFTGGEPFVARRQLQVIARAAADAGLDVSVVTAAHWAATPERAAALVAQFPMISCWDVSFDAHHLPWVDIAHIRHASQVVRDAGHKFTLRFTYSDPMTAEDMQILADLQAIGMDDVVMQAMRPVGRGADLHEGTEHGWSPWIKPCLTQGMVVRYDGSVSPCCLNLVESRRHPFDFGDPRVEDLVNVHGRFATDPLLQLIRALGFGPLQEWIRSEGLEHLLPSPAPEEACELCTAIMHQPALASFVRERAGQGDTPLKIAIIAAKVLGELDMLRAHGDAALVREVECHP
ncbi:radical SAM protein [Bradyrhizobium sp. HKCCYLS20291]|uniref:radical SAM protein n=1 Tax=Bradyrhizobium sp. HKCCYLS20291 TaxID=3420766 RepID=UPI003EC0B9C0